MSASMIMYVVVVSVIFLVTVASAAMGSPRMCRAHVWPKQKERDKVWSDKEKKYIESSTSWHETDRDEWLPVIYGAGYFRTCRRCGTTEYIRPSEYGGHVDRCLTSGVRTFDPGFRIP